MRWGNHSSLALPFAVALFQEAQYRADKFSTEVIAPGKSVPEDELFKMRGVGQGNGHRKMIAQILGFVKRSAQM